MSKAGVDNSAFAEHNDGRRSKRNSEFTSSLCQQMAAQGKIWGVMC